jgi:hypothetical protein
MSAYLVRLIQNRDIVGFFAADGFDDLVIAVDECTEVSACEFVELPPGGIVWTSPAVPVPIGGALKMRTRKSKSCHGRGPSYANCGGA